MKTGYIVLVILIIFFAYLAYNSLHVQQKPVNLANKSNGNTITTNSVTTTTIPNAVPCENVYGRTYNTINVSSIIKECSWGGGNVSLWVGSGPFENERFIAIGSDNLTYINQTANYSCITLYGAYKLPKQNYTIKFILGPMNSNALLDKCPFASYELNTTIVPSNHSIYQNVYNGNFSTGTFSGWNANGTAFGRHPLNITLANINGCYPENTPWTNYSATYFATTFSCNKTTRSYGSLSSSYFFANKPFLNFQAIGFSSPYIYVEILENNTPKIILHFNTYIGANTSAKTFSFRNITIPLATVYGKPVRVAIVANEIREYEYVAVGSFQLSETPNQYPGIISNITIK